MHRNVCEALEGGVRAIRARDALEGSAYVCEALEELAKCDMAGGVDGRRV